MCFVLEISSSAFAAWIESCQTAYSTLKRMIVGKNSIMCGQYNYFLV